MVEKQNKICLKIACSQIGQSLWWYMEDGVINICEAKYTIAPFLIDNGYEEILRNKMNLFINETSCKKALHLTFISASGLVHNDYARIVQNVITGDELFA